MNFPALLKSALAQAGLSCATAAPVLGVSQSALEKWHCGQTTPRPFVQEAILAKLANHTKNKP